MTKQRQVIGRWGEETAAAYLMAHGYKILDRNVRTPYGEIDLVASQNDGVVFIEVRTRTSAWLGFPEESINLRKQEHMLASAEYYAEEHELDNWQIDAIAIEGKPGENARITHFENVLE
jgi:putative endonuclease